MGSLLFAAHEAPKALPFALSPWLAFGAFIVMLVGLLKFHHHKNQVVYTGFAALAFWFVANHGLATAKQHGDVAYAPTVVSEGLQGLKAHFSDPHRSHLLWNLALLLPGFTIVAYYFESSGASHAIARRLKKDSSLLWVVFWLSTFLDNIAAAMIGGTILVALYGHGNVPFRMIVGVIAASNLGGAGSFLGDTTTVMLFLSGVHPAVLARAFVSTIPAQMLVNLWASRHDRKFRKRSDDVFTIEDSTHDEHDNQKFDVRKLLPLLGIPGLIIGNLKDQPGLGLWAGLLLGLLLGLTMINFRELLKAVPNTLFLVTLVATAEMLPLEAIRPTLESMGRDTVAILLGHLSAWFDNIPLTAIAINIGGFKPGLLAYAVGFGGTATWFGSSAGVAICQIFKNASDTPKWFNPYDDLAKDDREPSFARRFLMRLGAPFIAITGIYLVGCAIYLAFSTWIMPGILPYLPMWAQ